MLGSSVLWGTMTVTGLISASVMVTVWRMNATVPGVGQWTLGLVLAAVGILFTAARDVGLPLPVSVALGNGLVLAGFYYSWRGANQFLDTKRPDRRYTLAAFLVFVMIVLLYFSIFNNNFILRVAVISFAICVLDALCVLAFYRAGREHRLFTSGIVIIAYGSNGLIFLGRAIWTTTSLLGVPLPGLPLIMDVAGLFSIATPVLLAMGFLAISNEYLMAQLKVQAARDPLTGVYNRRAFFTIAEHLWTRHERNDQPVSVLTLDLDYFKAVNDAHGHAVGDEALRHVVGLIQDVLRKDDLLARFGGEEFLILLADTDGDEARAVAERIRLAVEAHPLSLCGTAPLRITGSLGVATTPMGQVRQTIHELIERADEALYRAKAEGRNRVYSADGAPSVASSALPKAG